MRTLIATMLMRRDGSAIPITITHDKYVNEKPYMVTETNPNRPHTTERFQLWSQALGYYHERIGILTRDEGLNF